LQTLLSRFAVIRRSFSELSIDRGREMQRPNCSVCGLPADETGEKCPHCGNKLAVGPKTQRARNQEPEGDSDFAKYLAVGVFAGALIAASLVLFLVFSSAGSPKGGDITPAQQTLIQSPTQSVPATTSMSPQGEGDDRKPAANPVRRGLKRTAPNQSDDSKRKRQDIIETPGKNPKMTQY
jgi:hypothetical protein